MTPKWLWTLQGHIAKMLSICVTTVSNPKFQCVLLCHSFSSNQLQAILRQMHRMRLQVCHICYTSARVSQISVRFAIRSTTFELKATSVTSTNALNDPKRRIPLRNQRYPIYVLLVPWNPNVNPFRFYDLGFSKIVAIFRFPIAQNIKFHFFWN